MRKRRRVKNKVEVKKMLDKIDIFTLILISIAAIGFITGELYLWLWPLLGAIIINLMSLRQNTKNLVKHFKNNTKPLRKK